MAGCFKMVTHCYKTVRERVGKSRLFNSGVTEKGTVAENS
jgi:hypothetical protein